VYKRLHTNINNNQLEMNVAEQDMFLWLINITPEQVYKLLTFRADKNHKQITSYETPYESLDFSLILWDNGL
jgi:hypothetical protein